MGFLPGSFKGLLLHPPSRDKVKMRKDKNKFFRQFMDLFLAGQEEVYFEFGID